MRNGQFQLLHLTQTETTFKVFEAYKLLNVYWMIIAAVPGPCQNFKVTSFTENTVSLTWEDPADDGGCLITGYVIENREASKRTWQRDGATSDMEYKAIALTEGTTYMFRVAAENEVGLGEFTELSKSVAPKSQYGEFSIT